MKLVNRLRTMVKIEKKPMDEWANWQLALIGGASALNVLYWSFMLKDVTPLLVKATNRYGINLEALACWLLLGIFAVSVWVFGCIAKKCHDVLYARIFPKSV